MCHVEYDQWYTLICKICNRYINNPSIYEIGGGTGVLAKLLKDSDFHYIGSDYSYEMCVESQKKNISFFCSDARHIPLKIRCNLVLFLYDGINYLLKKDDYRLLFAEVYLRLNNNGYFLFDITTAANSIINFLDFIDAEEFKDTSYTRHSYFDTIAKEQHNCFTIFQKQNTCENLYKKHYEHHIQKLFTVDEIKTFIPKDKFIIIGIWNDFSFNSYNEDSERIHFLLQKI